jgi:hypothetical protein
MGQDAKPARPPKNLEHRICDIIKFSGHKILAGTDIV